MNKSARLLLPVSLLAIVFTSLLAGCGKKEETTHAIRRKLVQAVYASGKVYPAQYIKVMPTVPGILQELFVKVGDSVKSGQPLFRIKNETTDIAIATARNNVQLAESYLAADSPYLSAITQEVESAYKKYQLDSSTLARTQGLRAANAGTDLQLDQARTQAATSKDTWQKALANLAATKQRLTNERNNARNALKAAQTQQNDFTVLAAIDGRIYDINVEVGELVGPQVPVLELGTRGVYEVELAVDESDANYIHQGQDVVFTAEYLGDTLLKGNITRVYPKITQLNKSIKAVASINVPAGLELYAGSTIEANIVYLTKPQALVLPRFFVLSDTVLVRTGLGTEKRKVKTGASDVEFVEILQGLTEAEEVVKP